MTKDSFQIAIDGPVAAGKGTVSRMVARRLGFLYIDTGAMYRVAAYLTHEQGWNVLDEQMIASLVDEHDIEIREPQGTEVDGRLNTVLLDGKDVSHVIRTRAVTDLVARVAALGKVREALVRKQQAIAAHTHVVMEGRDITYVVLPEADLKIYLDADARLRAKRRCEELMARGEEVDCDEVEASVLSRDTMDMQRDINPLKIVPEAWYLDSTDLTVEEVVELIVSRVETMRGV